MYRAATEPAPFVVISRASRVVAHDRRTGTPVWELVLDESNIHSGPVRCAIEGERVIIASTGPKQSAWNPTAEGVVTCVDYRTGRVLWEQRIPTGLSVVLVVPTMLIEGGQVIVTAGASACAMSLHDGTPQWSQTLPTATVTTTTCGIAIPGQAIYSDRS